MAKKPFPAAVVPAETLQLNTMAVSELPEALLQHLRGDEAFQGEDGALPGELRVILHDLDGSGRTSFFVAEPSSYTGGSIYRIFSPEQDGCRPQGSVQGWFYLAAPANGRAQIVADARAGGGEFFRTLFVFKDGEYRAKRAAAFRETGRGEVYLREEKPPQ